jgi:hypothetical protein
LQTVFGGSIFLTLKLISRRNIKNYGIFLSAVKKKAIYFTHQAKLQLNDDVFSQDFSSLFSFLRFFKAVKNILQIRIGKKN